MDHRLFAAEGSHLAAVAVHWSGVWFMKAEVALAVSHGGQCSLCIDRISLSAV